jgi:hypothetical protein
MVTKEKVLTDCHELGNADGQHHFNFTTDVGKRFNTAKGMAFMNRCR